MTEDVALFLYAFSLDISKTLAAFMLSFEESDRRVGNNHFYGVIVTFNI